MKRLIMFSLAACAVLAIGATPALAAKKGANSRTYEVTIENLTETQPLSPPLAVIHKKGTYVWKKGKIATHAVANIAEDADTTAAVQALPRLKRVHTATQEVGAPIGPGASATFTVKTKGAFNRLSLVLMLVNTNDAFTGLNSVKLNRGAAMRMFTRGAYDAGTEINNELESHIPGPCCTGAGVRAPEGDLIRKHSGIMGNGDLTVADHGWTAGKVAKITIKRVNS